jgi:hypothetical protein
MIMHISLTCLWILGLVPHLILQIGSHIWERTMSLSRERLKCKKGRMRRTSPINDTSTPTPVSTSTTTLGPITRARARRLTHQVSSLLSSGSSYLDNGDTCTLVLLRNNGLDQKGRGVAQAGFGLQDRHDF